MRAEGATDYDVNYKPADGGKWTNEPHRGTGLYTTINDLEPNTEYRWAARAENSDGASEWVFGPNFTTLADETTEEEVADGQAPAAPTNLRVAAVADSSCTVRWDAAEGATDYDVNYKPADGGKWTSYPHRGTGLYTTINDLEPGTEYRWAVRAENRDGRSEWVFGPNFTTLGADGQVTIPDAELRAAIAAALGKASGAMITVDEMKTLTGLETSDVGIISNLTGLEFATNLTHLWLQYNRITDISTLSGLTNLTELVLWNNNITDVSALSGLTNLKKLDLDDNNIRDISPLSGLTNLTHLWLKGNDISDISPLSGLTGLTELVLWNNNITDVSALSGLTNLKKLDLDDNNIRDISPLSGLTNLTHLWLEGNDIRDISPLSGLTNLILLQWSDPTPVFTTENLVAQHDGVAQHDDQVVVMSVPGRLTTDPIDFDALAQVFFAHYEDAFDYLMVFSNLTDIYDNQHYEYYGIHLSVQNTVQGTGTGLFSRNPEVGSAGRLNAILHFPYNSALLYGPSLHEIMHSWANSAIPTAVWAHWGFSSANGQLGGFDRANLIEHGGGRYSAGNFGTFANGGNSVPYSPIELYFAGLIPPSEVPDLWVAEDGEWSDEWDDASDAWIFTASQVSTWSIERIVAEYGARIPNSRESQKHFRAALILLIDSAHPAQQGTLDELSAAVQEFTHAGPSDDPFNFWEATGGRATLTMDGLSAYRRSGRASKPVVSYRIVEPVPNEDGHIGCVPMDDAAEAGKWMVAPSDKGKR